MKKAASLGTFSEKTRRWGTGILVAALLAAALVTAIASPSLWAAKSDKANPAKRAAKAKKGKKAKPAPATRPAPEPATKPIDPAKAARRAELVRMATDYLTKWYTKQVNNTDWMARAVALISVSRMPTDDATATLLKQMDTDRHPVCRLIAWQGVLARARMLSDAQHAAWMKSTQNMIRSDLFQGDLRIGLLEMIGSVPPDNYTRLYFQRLFAQTSSLDSADVPTLIAMGRCLKSWADARMVEMLIRCLGNPSTAVRAELVLQAAGVDVPWNRTPTAIREYSKWWQENKDKFTASPPKPDGWKKLKPQYLDPPVDPAKFDVLDLKWRHEMELKSLKLRSFAFSICLDCSKSMRPEIDRIRRDIMVMFSAFSEIAREVGVSLTLFAPGGEVKHYPLTDSQTRLQAIARGMDIFGPAGDEEWAGAIDKAMHANRWPALAKDTARAIVIISDEPIADAQFQRALPLAENGAKYGFKIYGVMVQKLNAPNNPLARPLDRTTGGSMYDPNNPLFKAAHRGGGRGSWDYYNQLAKATGGRAFDAQVPQGGLGLGMAPKARGGGANKNKGKAKNKNVRAFDPMAIAPIYPGGGPTTSILTIVLTDAIGPGHRDRVEPLVKILAAYCQKAAAKIPERRVWQTPGHMEPNNACYK